MIHQRVTLKHIAARAGVHVTTVSMALRNSPRLAAATRTRLQELAAEMGYQPDPMLSSLMVYRKNTIQPHYQGTLAWINTDPVAPQQFVSDLRKGAEERCQELGYQLETLYLSKMGPDRLAKICLARNIQGLMFPPLMARYEDMILPWDRFSTVGLGLTLSRMRHHVVANAQYHSARLGLRALNQHGYRRIGFVSSPDSDERTDHNFSSGYQVERDLLLKKGEQSAVLPILNLTDEYPSQKLQFKAWYEEHRPDAILTLLLHCSRLMGDLGISYEECGLALLALTDPNGEVAGVCQNDHVIGRSAVDFLVGMIQRNERGMPSAPLQILVESSWLEGATVPRPALRPLEMFPIVA